MIAVMSQRTCIAHICLIASHCVSMYNHILILSRPMGL